ncbi:MAG TPA: TMEM175 family protein [Polyangia bacterium]|nr:TMEM175 family protein [Polyangia bacterium]
MAAESHDTARLEAFSDGVFAIAITLLVLELKVPRELAAGEPLAHALARQWPSYLAFGNSFLTIGIMWMNHHRLFTHIRRSNQALMLFNLLLLMGITVVPFPTALLAEYLGHPQQRMAAQVYTGTFVVIAILFNLLWRYGAHGRRLLHDRADLAAVSAISRQYAFGPLLYGLCFALAFFNVAASVSASVALALFFAVPPRRRG